MEHQWQSKAMFGCMRAVLRGAAWLALGIMCLSLPPVRAADPPPLAEVLRRVDELDARRDFAAAIKLLEAAQARSPQDAEVLIRLAKQQSNLIFSAPSEPEKKRLAELCLATAERAVAAAPESARARLAVGICLAKNFPFVDNQTKVNYSRRLKEETERAVALDPRQDLAYHMLARWHFEVAKVNFILRAIAKLVYGGLPQGTLAEARANLERAIALAPGRIIHRYQLALTLLAMGQNRDAVEQLRRCLSLEPVDADDAEAKQEADRQLKKLGAGVAKSAEPAAK